MQTIIVKVDTIENAKQITALLKKTKGVQSVNKESSDFDWVNPLRAATNDEVEKMILSAEESPLFTVNEAEENTYGKIV
ncbi:MAG: hypothetical protein NTX03_14585 [Bacteroidetes bacterium]|nr:hypothetical protein [Bacteroidota bacterium]